MTGLLVSVRDAAEAELAIQAGVDLLDVKEPRRGALGSADCATIRQVVEAANRQAAVRNLPISVALGELTDVQNGTALPCCEGIGFAKFGLAGCVAIDDWPARWAAALDQLPSAVGRVAVIYADWKTARAPQPDEILRIARQVNCRAALVDTFDKRAGSLLDLWSLDQIEDFIRSAQSQGLLAVVGGGLKRANISCVVALAPDYVAVRGAACRGQRWDTICRERVEQLVKLVRSTAEAGACNRHRERKSCQEP